MKQIHITIANIKEIKKLMTEVDTLRENSFSYNIDGYGSNQSGKEANIEAKESYIESEIAIVASLLKVDYNTVVDMCYDLDYANRILN